MYEELLKKYDIRITEPRKKILAVLESTKKPVSIDILVQKIPSINQSTLYRSLAEMVAKGLVYQTDLRTGKAYFELHHKDHHHHFVCTTCHTLIDIPCDFFSEVALEKFSKKHNVTVTNHMIELFGICTRCK
jgi:Fur family transcriptional regulator, ferric uptake regulator